MSSVAPATSAKSGSRRRFTVDALFTDGRPQAAGVSDLPTAKEIRLDRIVPDPAQPRRTFDPARLEELAASITLEGVLQPIVVRYDEGDDIYVIVHGERRWRASKLAGLTEVPIIERTANDREVLELALIENLQRENLNPIEEATAYARLSREFNMRQEDIAQRVGKNRATVANAMRLLDLPTQVQSMLSQGAITTGHAKVKSATRLGLGRSLMSLRR